MRTKSRRGPGSNRVDRILRDLPTSYAAIAAALRATIRKEAPGLVEAVKWNNPFWRGREDVVCLQCYPHHVNLAFLRGAELARTHPEIEGTGKAMRHVKVASIAAANSETVRGLIRAAVELDRKT